MRTESAMAVGLAIGLLPCTWVMYSVGWEWWVTLVSAVALVTVVPVHESAMKDKERREKGERTDD